MRIIKAIKCPAATLCVVAGRWKEAKRRGEKMKTISDKIFELLKEKGMSQKEFAQRTGIAESSISDWKKKRTNPVSDKILIICEVLDVTPYELLSGAEHAGNRRCG